jgi:hypothetical protein
MKHFTYQTQVSPSAAALEWKPDIERLRAEIGTARRAGYNDHLAIAEAECWIDLIDAELSARRDRLDDPEIHRLRRWKADLTSMLKQ